MYPLVEKYFDRLMLAKLGYKFDPSDLKEYDVECFRLIANTIVDLENKEMKKAGRSGKK